MFNTEGGADEESTSTVIHIQNPDDDEQVIDIEENTWLAWDKIVATIRGFEIEDEVPL